jgi:hypothetical protein
VLSLTQELSDESVEEDHVRRAVMGGKPCILVRSLSRLAAELVRRAIIVVDQVERGFGFFLWRNSPIFDGIFATSGAAGSQLHGICLSA